MNKDLGFLAFSLLSWGLLLHSVWIALGLLLLLGAIKSSSWRWTLNPKQLHRWGDVSVLLIVLVLIFVYFIQPSDQPTFVVLKCLPVLLMPVLLAQLLSQQAQIPLSVLFYSLRRKSRSTDKTIDFQLPFAAITMLSAGAANVQDARYFVLVTVFFMAVLWTVRPKQSRILLWLSVMTLAVFLSFFGQLGLRHLHTVIEQQSINWISNWNADPFKAQTSIGELGELKLSSHIEFRLKAEGQLLLHQASYDRYLGRVWITSKRVFTLDNPEHSTDTLPLKHLEILQQKLDNTVLALPDGTVKITGLEDATLHYTEFGAVKVDMPSKSGDYQVFYTGKRTGKPSPNDLQIPKQHADWLQAVSVELKLAGKPPKVIAERIKDHFQARFFYRLYQASQTDADTALRAFMLNTKAGHCEYFAAATVFLLRQAGIPARFATGYSVSEYIPEQDLYRVRRSDAHAWAIAYLDGVWEPIDSTPGQWQSMEKNHARGLRQLLSDAWSNTRFYLGQWQVNDAQKQQFKIVGLLLLAGYLTGRLFNAKRKPHQTLGIDALKPVGTGLDSEFYLLEHSLQNTPEARFNNESFQHWVLRLNRVDLQELCQLHYQLRFDPQGLSVQQRQQLRQQVYAWLAAKK